MAKCKKLYRPFTDFNSLFPKSVSFCRISEEWFWIWLTMLSIPWMKNLNRVFQALSRLCR